MRRFIACVAALALASGFAGAAPVPGVKLPLVTAHIQPLDKLEADLGQFVELIGGKDASEKYKAFMEKDYAIAIAGSGVDPKKPFLGYADLNDDIALSTGTLLVPIINEKAFIAFSQKFPESNPIKFEKVKGNEGLYEVTRTEGEFPVRVLLRFAHGYAYFGANTQPKDMDEAKLVPPADLAAKDTILTALRIHPDRLPAAHRKNLLAKFDGLVDDMIAKEKALPNADMQSLAMVEGYTLFAKRLLRQVLDETDAAALELVANPKTREFSLEIRATPKKGSFAAKDIAARTPDSSLLAGFMAKDVAASYHQTSFGIKELRSFFDVAKADMAKKLDNDPPPEALRPLLDEALDLYVRSFKNGKGDIAAAAYGPGPKNAFHYAAVVTVDDPSKIEKILRNLHTDPMFEAIAKEIELDAGKVGKVAIHRVKVKNLPNAPPQIPEGTACIAFAPQAVFLTHGPDSLAMIEKLIVAKPAPAKQWEASVNPAKFVALVETFDPNAAKMAEQVLGKNDRLISALDFDITGGTELRIRIGMNAEVLPKLIAVMAVKKAMGGD